jgi:hypothetical protein
MFVFKLVQLLFKEKSEVVVMGEMGDAVKLSFLSP